jgi:ribbon-helix-helix CopG family protein
MKTQVYSWRLSSDLKMDLEREARRQGVSVSALLERMAQEWLACHHSPDDEAEQARIRARVEKVIGKISGGGPYTAEHVRKRVQENLVKNHGC